MADSEEVLRQLDPPDDVEIVGIVVNEKGAERAIATEAVRTLGFPYSVSPTFLEKNQNQTPEENSELLEKVAEKAFDAGLDVVVYISMAFGNPYGDAWSANEVLEAVGMMADMDIRCVSLADTVGLAAPGQIAELLGAVAGKFDYLEIGAHLHSRRDQAVAQGAGRVRRRMPPFRLGDRRPGRMSFAQDALIGNIPTEMVLEALAQRGDGLPIRKPLESVMAMNTDIAARFPGR